MEFGYVCRVLFLGIIVLDVFMTVIKHDSHELTALGKALLVVQGIAICRLFTGLVQ